MSKRSKRIRRWRYYCNRYREGRISIDELDLTQPPDRCWCGVENPYFAPVHGTCGGYGTIICYCGGDLCVCHHHGEAECFGCPDCEGDQDDGDDYRDDYDHGD